MKKIYYFAVALISLGFVMSSCGDDDDNGDIKSSNILNVSVVDAASIDADSVFFMVYRNQGDRHVLGKEAFNGGNFSMTLSTPDESLLESFKNDEGNIPDGLTVSNPNVSTFAHNVLLATKNGNYVGVIILANDSNYKNATSMALFMYATGAVSVQGVQTNDEDMEKYKLNLSLAAGWNTVIMKTYEEGDYLVEEMISGSTSGLKWYFATGFDIEK